MPVRFVDDNERLELLRDHIKVAAEIVEAFRVMYEDGISIVPERAVEMLDEAANRLQCAHIDTYDSVDDGSRDQIDVPYEGDLNEVTFDDTMGA